MPPKTPDQVRPLVCFIGTLRALELTAPSLLAHLIEPLKADVAICASRLSSRDEQALDLLAGARIVDTCLYEDANEGYSALCDSLSNELFSISSQNSMPWRKALAIEGNWLGGLEGRQGSGMHLNYNYYKLKQRLLLPSIASQKYTHFIITRTDFRWLASHPQVHLLDDRLIWMPEGEDYQGYNDRHAVCSSRTVMSFLGFFESLLSGQALAYLQDYRSLNHEYQLKLHLNFSGIRVGRFKNLAYLTGSPSTGTNWANLTSKTVDGTVYYCKYPGELDSSILNSRALLTASNVRSLIVSPPRLRSRLPIWKTRLRYSSPAIARLLNRVRGGRLI